MIELQKYKFYFLFYSACISIYILAILPSNLAPTIGNFSDKAHHIFAFIVLSLLLQLSHKLSYLWHFLLLSFYGVFIEFSQLFAVQRSAELLDILADIVGVSAGLFIFYIFCYFFSTYSLCKK